MEGQVGGKVAPPVFFHRQLTVQFHEAAPLGKKRDFPHHQQRLMGASLPNNNRSGNWNPNMWDWDSFNFVAKPSVDASDVLRAAGADLVPRKNGEEDGENLTLKLGGDEYSAAAEPASRPNKRVRSGPPGSGGSYPRCQVDDCRADLSNAKDYHRRHKVCEVHSKTAKALVGKLMQRFCQQCSRFHPLSEFDEGKRSCRRQLAGHNRRRRKIQPEDVSSRLLLSSNQENAINGNLDIVNLLAILARFQGKLASLPPLPDRDRLIQVLSKISNLNTANSSSRLLVSRDFDLNVSQASQQGLFEQSPKGSKNPAAPSTRNLLAAASSALTASAPEAIASLSHGSSDSSGNDKAKIQCAEPATDTNSLSKPIRTFPSVGVERTNCVIQSPIEVPEQPVHEARPSFPLQLFGPAEGDSPLNLGSAVKYLSSESSNPMEERSSSSPPVTQKLFPLHSAEESMKNAKISNCREDNAMVELSISQGLNAPLELFKESQRQVANGAVQKYPYQAGYTSSSGSDHLPFSSISDAQDRTGRIIFKLFDKDPSNLPGTLRAQILNWLSHSPSEMESYIRPGCVVLSVYLSMPSIAWDQLEEDLLKRVTSLVQCSESEFWRTERFLVRTNRQLVSHKDGKIRLCKSWRTWGAPELTSVSPVAVVSGQETSLVLKGHNLMVPGTKIHCTYMGRYTSKDVLCSVYPGNIYDDYSVESFDFHGASPKMFGRCFIEVENGFKGNSFPVIIGDTRICQELRLLESEFEEDVRTAGLIPEDLVQENGKPRSSEDALHFLNELGWLFQKTNASSSPDFSTRRFNYLLTFSVERDWCALIKTLLDMLAERNSRNDALSQETLEMLLEIHLLNRAVKRKCRKMVDLLIHYSVRHGNDNTNIYLFPPNLAGPGGLTPLHLAASTEGSEGMVDALTNDPQEIGLNCWDSLRDDNGQSPYMYATLKNNHSYNSMVVRKLEDRKNGQVSISVGHKDVSFDKSWITGEGDRAVAHPSQARSCALCALACTGRLRQAPHTRGLLDRPYIHSMLAIAAVCVCVCLFLRGSPHTGSVSPFKWENLDFGPR